MVCIRANLRGAPLHFNGVLHIPVGGEGALEDVEAEGQGGRQGRRVLALKLARAAGIVAIEQEGLEGPVEYEADQGVEDTDEGEWNVHGGFWGRCSWG